MLGDWFYSTNEWLIFGIVIALLLLAAEMGYRLGCKYRLSMDEGARSSFNTLQAASIGILALIMAFTLFYDGYKVRCP